MLSDEERFKINVISAISDIKEAVDQLELVCEDLIDCNDARLIAARAMLSAVDSSIETLTGKKGN